MIHTIDAEPLTSKGFTSPVEHIEGLTVEGVTLLRGASKIGKSWLTLQLYDAIATGRTEIAPEII